MDLAALVSVDPVRAQALDWFIGSCLSEGGIWESPRTSDGLHAIVRVLERGPDALRVCGRVYQIDQTIHAFWLELHRDGVEDRFSWFLCFDIAEPSARRTKNALDNHDRFEEIEWRVKLAGEAVVDDGSLTILPGSTRVLVRDMPTPELPMKLRRRTRGRHR